MASSKAKARNRPVAGKGNTPARGPARNNGGSARDNGRTTRATSTTATRVPPRGGRPAPEPAELAPAGPPPWLRMLALALAIVGLGVSAYLTYTHFADKPVYGCSDSGAINCTKVTTSPQSMIFNHIPVALTGLIFYVYLVAIMSPWAWNSTWKWMPKLRLASVVAGVGMVLYLVYAELFQIDAICLFCTTVHVVTFLLFVLITVSAALWGLAPPARTQQQS